MKESRDLGKTRERRHAARQRPECKSRGEALARLGAAIASYHTLTEANVDRGKWSDRDEGWSARAHVAELRAILTALEVA